MTGIGSIPVKDVEIVTDRVIRKLAPEEHGKTRKLYEVVFPEKEAAFLDYYYDEVASKNEIYGVTEGEDVLSMVHLNSYEICVGKEECRVPHMIAAAVHPMYRHQGMMTGLFRKTFGDLYMKKVPFAFLRPMRDMIFHFLGFRYISGQNRMEMKVTDYLGGEQLEVHPATYADVPDLVWISDKLLKGNMGIYAKRTEGYYERLLLEMECQEGDIAVLSREGMICGWFLTSVEQGLPVVREAFVKEDLLSRLLPTIAECFRYDDIVRLYGFSEKLGGECVPDMMGRIVNLEAYMSLVSRTVPERFSFALKDHWIPENNGAYIWSEGKLWKVAEEPVFPLFCVEEFMEKFPLPGPVFLNEVV